MADVPALREFLAVVGQHRHHRTLPQPRRFERLQDPTQPVVPVPHLRVVEVEQPLQHRFAEDGPHAFPADVLAQLRKDVDRRTPQQHGLEQVGPRFAAQGPRIAHDTSGVPLGKRPVPRIGGGVRSVRIEVVHVQQEPLVAVRPDPRRRHFAHRTRRPERRVVELLEPLPEPLQPGQHRVGHDRRRRPSGALRRFRHRHPREGQQVPVPERSFGRGPTARQQRRRRRHRRRRRRQHLLEGQAFRGQRVQRGRGVALVSVRPEMSGAQRIDQQHDQVASRSAPPDARHVDVVDEEERSDGRPHLGRRRHSRPAQLELELAGLGDTRGNRLRVRLQPRRARRQRPQIHRPLDHGPPRSGFPSVGRSAHAYLEPRPSGDRFGVLRPSDVAAQPQPMLRGKGQAPADRRARRHQRRRRRLRPSGLRRCQPPRQARNPRFEGCLGHGGEQVLPHLVRHHARPVPGIRTPLRDDLRPRPRGMHRRIAAGRLELERHAGRARGRLLERQVRVDPARGAVLPGQATGETAPHPARPFTPYHERHRRRRSRRVARCTTGEPRPRSRVNRNGVQPEHGPAVRRRRASRMSSPIPRTPSRGHVADRTLGLPPASARRSIGFPSPAESAPAEPSSGTSGCSRTAPRRRPTAQSPDGTRRP